MRNRITGVVVTYNNVSMLKELLNDLGKQTRPPDNIIVVDNASTDSTQSCLSCEYPRIRYVRLAENTGSSGGYCAGLEAALPDSDLILTLDDDLRLENNTLEELEKSFEQFNKTDKVAAVRATVSDGVRPDKERFLAFTWRGTLLNCSAIKEVGLPVNDFFIYGEDLEYSLRLNKAGYSFYWAPLSRYSNPRIGDKQYLSFCGKPFMYYTDDFRLYYSFRNELSVYLRHRCFWRVLRMFLFAGKIVFWMACFDRKSFLSRTRAILLGLGHGVLGVRRKVF